MVLYPQRHYLLFRGVFKNTFKLGSRSREPSESDVCVFEKAAEMARAVLGAACAMPSQAGAGGRGPAGSAGPAGGAGVLTGPGRSAELFALRFSGCLDRQGS